MGKTFSAHPDRRCTNGLERVEGTWKKQIKGKEKEHWNQSTDDDLHVIGGRRDQLEGKIQQRCGLAVVELIGRVHWAPVRSEGPSRRPPVGSSLSVLLESVANLGAVLRASHSSKPAAAITPPATIDLPCDRGQSRRGCLRHPDGSSIAGA
jgi:uncharacterized protein YjbJ (UPF0337 family)